jgi:pimeloyl-ACP methyl ester carboxylesterase
VPFDVNFETERSDVKENRTMAYRRRACIPALIGALIATFVFCVDTSAQQRPPASPPAEWGPLSINLEEIKYPHPVRYFDLNLYGQDVRIAYMDVAPTGAPNGRTVVLLHGGSYYGWYWKAQIEALAKAGYRVVVEDRLGWGKSSKPILPYSISLHASNTVALLDHLRIDKAAIVGHSIGGQMATRIAFLYPTRLTHLVLVNPIGLTDNRAGRGFTPFDGKVDVQPDLQAAYEADVRTELSRYVVWRPEYLEHLRIRHGVRLSAEWPRLAYVRELGGNLRSVDSTVNDWPHIKTKAMVLGGEQDGPSFPADARRAVDTLPNAELVLIPQAGHNPHEEKPDVVNAELLRFLGSDPAAPAVRRSSR